MKPQDEMARQGPEPRPEADASGPPAPAGAHQDPLDAWIWSTIATFTRGSSPIAFATAWFDVLAHLGVAPGQRRRLALDAGNRLMNDWFSLWSGTARPSAARAGEPGPRDTYETFLHTLSECYDDWTSWLGEACLHPHGVSRANAERVAFSLRQAREATHPRNLFWTNPDALRTAREESGASVLRGLANLLEDLSLGGPGHHAETGAHERLGRDLAATPGRVVYRNRLIELIQYEPASPLVAREPVLVVPAWIMKYYILDLSPGHSLIEYLVSQGYTVFAISWRNPGHEDRNLGFDDYRTHGVLAALDAISALVPQTGIHTVGYCLGGTLLSVAAAGLARDGDRRIASLSLFAAQTDFADAGELALFIDDAQIAALEAGMEAAGYLDGDQMAGAFAMLRSRDIIWRRMQEDYLIGRRGGLVDLMVWNADTTRMPARMHSEYLRRFFLNNDFANGRISIDGRPVAISDIRAPVFALGTTHDHVAPWKSVFKIHLFADTEVTFALTNGGHNAGVVSPPGHKRRRHHIHTKADCEHYVDPNAWLDDTDALEGSWWPSWAGWLAERSTGEVAARAPSRADTPGNALAQGAPLCAAPGRYVLD